MNFILIFSLEIIAFASLALAEAEIEGKHGGGGKKARFFKFGPIRVRRYHLFMNFLTIPIFILLAFAAGGFGLKLFGTLASGALIGGLFQDFVWFIVNPYYGIKKFNSKNAYWLVWWKLGKIELPYFYITNTIIAILIWLFLVV